MPQTTYQVEISRVHEDSWEQLAPIVDTESAANDCFRYHQHKQRADGTHYKFRIVRTEKTIFDPIPTR